MRRLSFDVLPFGEWPAADATAWAIAVADGGPFDPRGPLAHHSQTSLREIQRGYGRWLGFLTSMGFEADAGLVMAEDADKIEALVSTLQAVAPCTARAYLTALYTACRGLRPDIEFTFLHRAMRWSWRTARPTGDKQARIVPARDLARLGRSLMQEAASLSTALKRASRYQDGLMITMLIHAPARISSFLSMRIDHEMLWDGLQYRMCFQPHQVKNRRYLEYPLPIELSESIRIWLNVHRPTCLTHRGRWHQEHGNDAFWISESGAPFLNAKRVRERIARITQSRLGRRVNPHLFRDCAATSIASEIPEDVGIIRSVLGHTTLETGTLHYNHANSIGAARGLQAIVDTYRLHPAI